YGHPSRRRLLSDLPSLGHPETGRSLLSAVPGVSSIEAAVRSCREVSERLVSSLQEDVRLSRRYAPWLWALLTLFCGRVFGQLLVALFSVRFLPPMEEWFSGTLAYRPLLGSQILIILLYGKVALDFTRCRGFFTRRSRSLSYGLLLFGALYLGVMLIRYAIRMSLYPHERWTGGSIPIFFHWILAS